MRGAPDRAGVSRSDCSVSGLSSNNINLLNPVNDGHVQFADNLTWVRGRHTLKLGLEHVNFFVNRYMPNTSGIPIFGSYSFTPEQHNGYPQNEVVMSRANSQKDGAFALAPGYG